MLLYIVLLRLVYSVPSQLLSQYESLYSSLVIKLQSLRCPWCSCSRLTWVRRLRLQFCDAADCGGSSWYSVWCGLFNILSNSWLSASSNSWSKSGMSGGQKRFSVAAAEKCVYALAVGRRDEPAPRDTSTARKTASRPIWSVISWT